MAFSLFGADSDDDTFAEPAAAPARVKDRSARSPNGNGKHKHRNGNVADRPGSRGPAARVKGREAARRNGSASPDMNSTPALGSVVPLACNNFLGIDAMGFVNGLLDLRAEDECSGFGGGSELFEGNVEYKLKLVSIAPERFAHLVTQMHYRLNEGKGEAFYRIGVTDSGDLRGLEDADLRESLATVCRMADALGCSILISRVARGVCGRCVELAVRRRGADFIDIRVCVLGDADAGKSTLVGVLTSGRLDDGKGSARVSVFRHRHEVQAGRTSSISHRILGFDSKGAVTSSGGLTANSSIEDVVEESAKVLTLVDLAGHERYLKTTVRGLAGHLPDFAVIVVSASGGVPPMTLQHIRMALALRIPPFVVLTKSDAASAADRARVLSELREAFPARFELLAVDSEAQAEQAAALFSTRAPAADPRRPSTSRSPAPAPAPASAATGPRRSPPPSTPSPGLAPSAPPTPVPVLTVSSVSGAGLGVLRAFLRSLPRPRGDDWTRLQSKPAVFAIDEVFNTEAGPTVSGVVLRGCLRVGESVLLGPDQRGSFSAATVGSIHTQRNPAKLAAAGQSATVAIGGDPAAILSGVRPGMVLAHPSARPRASMELSVLVHVLHAPSAFRLDAQVMVNAGTAYQAARVVSTQPFEPAAVEGDGKECLCESQTFTSFAEARGVSLSPHTRSLSGRSPGLRAADGRERSRADSTHWSLSSEQMVDSLKPLCPQCAMPTGSPALCSPPASAAVPPSRPDPPTLHLGDPHSSPREPAVPAAPAHPPHATEDQHSDSSDSEDAEDLALLSELSAADPSAPAPPADSTALRTGDRAVVRLRFCFRPECLLRGSKLILRQGAAKAIGRILQTHPLNDPLSDLEPRTDRAEECTSRE